MAMVLSDPRYNLSINFTNQEGTSATKTITYVNLNMGGSSTASGATPEQLNTFAAQTITLMNATTRKKVTVVSYRDLENS